MLCVTPASRHTYTHVFVADIWEAVPSCPDGSTAARLMRTLATQQLHVGSYSDTLSVHAGKVNAEPQSVSLHVHSLTTNVVE